MRAEGASVDGLRERLPDFLGWVADRAEQSKEWEEKQGAKQEAGWTPPAGDVNAELDEAVEEEPLPF